MHHVIDERSRYMHTLIAERLRLDPSLLDVAKANLQRWLTTCSPRVKTTFVEWDALLHGDFQVLLELLTSESEGATRLRQSSPFVGEEFLSRAERNEIIRRFHDPVST